MDVDVMDENALRVANALDDRLGGGHVLDRPLAGVSLKERTALLERACSMRVKLELLIKHLAGSVRRYYNMNPPSTEAAPVRIAASHQISASDIASEGQSTVCGGHFCGHCMDPVLWSRLPKELLQMVSYPETYNLRLLSKGWTWNQTANEL